MTKNTKKPESEKSGIYQIKIKEKLDKSWANWFGEMKMTVETDKKGKSITVLTGPVVDQAALNGVLNKIWNLNLTVL